MNFELLPNEILLNLFEYFSTFHLFHGFFDLNSRFNKLLCVHFQKFHLDFRLISKTNFDHICQNYISLIIDRIISLHLSNDDDTPQQIELFLSHNYQLRQFVRLQSISFTDLQSQQTLDRIMIECSHLPCLTHLTLTGHHILMNKSDANRFFNHIWSLTNLKHCDLDISCDFKNYFQNLTIISTSLRHLIIEHSTCSLSTLTHLCQHTPHLEYLSITFKDRSDQLELSLPIFSITRLKIRFYSSIKILQHLLEKMPNLYHLDWQTDNLYVSGYQWEEVIRKYLPKLKIFQFKTSFLRLNDEDKELQLNRILDTYRTKFWINEHQWFVRCHWYIYDENDADDFIDLFTLSYTFNHFSANRGYILAKSTCPYGDKYLSCNYLTTCYYKSSPLISSIASQVRFRNIQDLSLVLPSDDQFLSNGSKLDQLTSLCIMVHKYDNLDIVQSQLQFLLDRAPRLRSLRFGEWSPFSSKLPPMELTSVSVRQLDLLTYIPDGEWHCFDDKQWIQLCRSPLGKQCETLLMKVKSRKNILDLVNNMPNLQALHVRWEDDSSLDGNDLVSLTDDELVEWLRQQLPSTCAITSDTYFGHNIRVWIR